MKFSAPLPHLHYSVLKGYEQLNGEHPLYAISTDRSGLAGNRT